MEKILKAQPLAQNNGYNPMASKKILEINLHHKIIKGLKEKNESTKNVIRLLFESAMLESGFQLDDPK